MGACFGNTLVIVIPGQWKAKRYFLADHSYWQTGDDGPVTGRGEVKDRTVCTTKDNAPLDRARTYCNDGVGRQAGDAWTDADPVTGSHIDFSLQEGRPPRP
jgi:hypothetical protein